MSTSENATLTNDATLPGPCEGWGDDAPLIRSILDRVGDKWGILVIAVLRDTPMRYKQLHRSVPGISQRMLTLTLRHLERDGLVTRTVYPEVPPRVDYALTHLGVSLLEHVLGMAMWASEHTGEIRHHRDAFDQRQSGTA
ncbi:MAG: helix-turn-helix domain-containing protein [Corynebacteriales bacterium]|uniref:Helix-turn-helix transcriptional regulator n=1 Tax=Williamsia herbipolensis TaxID=1603258 RepID=A0AAU4JZ70_9NOCA|nr:helix-turn-helix domain-containing protein [Williamsia herbipolensis]MCX6471917.1 helix-turn-helix domain-containing protein [Mycobacteriales bacterium]